MGRDVPTLDLRDCFAIAALFMFGLMGDNEETADETADAAYNIANAMMRARGPQLKEVK